MPKKRIAIQEHSSYFDFELFPWACAEKVNHSQCPSLILSNYDYICKSFGKKNDDMWIRRYSIILLVLMDGYGDFVVE